MKIYICDDNKLICDDLSKRITGHFGTDPEICCFYDFDSLKRSAENKYLSEPEIIILDIMVGEINGCFEAKEIHRLFPDAKIIFLTGYPELVKDIFVAVEPSNILIKPLDDDRLIRAVEKAYKEYSDDKGSRAYIVKQRTSETKLKYREIIYAESIGHKVKLYTACGEYAFYKKMSEFIDETDGYFILCHQSFAVNKSRIKALHPTEIIMDDGTSVRVSRARYPVLRDIILDDHSD